MAAITAGNRTLVLLSAMLTISVAWGVLRIPDTDLPVAAFTFLTSAFLADESSFRARTAMALVLALYSSAAQLLIAVTPGLPVLQITLSTCFAFFTFASLPDFRAGCIVLLTGYLSFFAPSGFLSACGRAIDIFCGIIVILVITALCGLNKTQTQIKYSPCSIRKSVALAAQLGAGNLIFQLFQLDQGPWIMLTILFITMAETPEASEKKLALQRIFAVPAGIIAGGFLLSTFSRIDPRLVYLVPFIGAAGFFFLYKQGNFFLFSLIFMVTITVFSDWMTGAYTQVHFRETLMARSLSSLIGAILTVIFRKRSTVWIL